ncbi:uncharacterized protein LMH87_009132 [Akanthomyces muscarius]|uniref:SCP2 domain-containing protein n=1 Tax=Akanthomyces muscarius TaxID=2231603 RepID=A0A9W8QK23_AKAMU|nr:uncharacterized protein LMH87_009132 [Akanthomyces muscarius]KAJ4158614.1 hypothetical protein LMH87_009132 [Akanthomyces muscarius]
MSSQNNQADSSQALKCVESRLANEEDRTALISRINAVIAFNIGSESWSVDLKQTGTISKPASESRDMTITVSDEDFMKIHNKKLNAQMAGMQGKLKFDPKDMGLLHKVAYLW